MHKKKSLPSDSGRQLNTFVHLVSKNYAFNLEETNSKSSMCFVILRTLLFCVNNKLQRDSGHVWDANFSKPHPAR